MTLCKFTLGVAAGFAGALLYDAYKKGKISCCLERCCGGSGEDYIEKGREAAHNAVDKAAEKGKEIKHGFEAHAAEPLGDLAGR